MKKYATVANYKMAYHYFDSPSNEVVVLIHGIPTNAHLWEQIIPYLTPKYKVIAVDMIGYGDSDRGPYYDLTLPKQANYIIELLNQLGIHSAHFVGHDLGGGVVQILSVYHPNRMKSMVVADGVTISNWPLPKVVSIRWPTAKEFEPTPTFIERMLREGVYYPQVITPKIVYDFVTPFAGPKGGEYLQQASFALNHRQTEELVPYLSRVQTPTTLLWGENDRYLPPYWAKLLQETLPNAKLNILGNCSHYSMLDNPSLFSENLLEHLNNSSIQK